MFIQLLVIEIKVSYIYQKKKEKNLKKDGKNNNSVEKNAMNANKYETKKKKKKYIFKNVMANSQLYTAQT